MNLADLRRRERIVIAVAEMIVVRAENDVFVGFAGQIREHVVHRGARGFDVHVDRQMHMCSETRTRRAWSRH